MRQLNKIYHKNELRWENDENEISEKTLSMLMFLNGDFKEIINQILNDDSYYLNQNYMVASFLLLLFNHFELHSGYEFICSKIISEIDFNH